MPANSQIPLPPTMQRCWWRWFWSHLHVLVATIKPSLLLIQTSKPFFLKQPNFNIWFYKEVLSNFKRRLGSLSSLKDFLSISAFLKVILMKKLRFLKNFQLGFVFGVQGMSNQFIGKPNLFANLSLMGTPWRSRRVKKSKRTHLSRGEFWLRPSGPQVVHCSATFVATSPTKVSMNVAKSLWKLLGVSLHQTLKQRPPRKGGPARFVVGDKGVEEGNKI